MTLLSYFPAHRALQSEVQALAARLVIAESQANTWRSECQAAKEREQQTAAEKDRVYKMICNCEAVRSGSPIVPFPDVYVPMPEPPRNEEQEPPEPRKRRADEAVRDARREFVWEYAEMVG